MNLSLLSLGLLGFLRLATATFVASWVSSPMSWSPDGEWLSYTVVIDGEQDRFRPGWIFLTADKVSEPPVAAIRRRAGRRSIESGRYTAILYPRY